MDKEKFLIDRLRSEYTGDDGAVVGNTIYSMDAFCEGTHYKREWMSPAQTGRKAMLVNISDAVAMNAKPEYALLSLSIPPDFENDDIAELMDSIERTAQEYGCELIGGDTVGGESLHLSIALISHSDDPLLRKGLREGDLLAYTGVLGESKRDLQRLFRGEKIEDDSRFYEPVLRQKFISESRSLLSAGMDISDGLYCDTNKLLDMNDMGFEPVIDIDEETGSSGEEYEMLISFAAEKLDEVLSMAADTDVQITVFARAVKNGARYPCSSHHFK